MTNQTRRLILIRHSIPEISSEIPASQWALSDQGRRRCEALADRLAAYDLAAIITSTEPKAIETRQIVAGLLGIRWGTAPSLHEHERHTAGWQVSQEPFQVKVSSVFENPDKLIFGSETADEAHRRFTAAMTLALERHPFGNLGVVTHGTVMTLFIARAASLDPFPFWQRLGLPSFAVLSLPDMQPLDIVESV